MDKNLLWAVSLSIAIYAFWFGVVEKRYVKHAPPAVMAVAQTPAERFSSRPAHTPANVPGAAAASSLPPQAAPESLDRATLAAQADLLPALDSELRIHPRGAAVVSCLYQDKMGAVELVNDPAPGLFATWPELSFTRQPAAAGMLRYAASRPDGARIVKEFLPEGKDSLPRIRVTLSNPTRRPLATGSWSLSIGPGLGTVPNELGENTRVWRALGLPAEGGGPPKAFKPGPQPGAFAWLGVDNRYFLAAVLPQSGDFDAVESASPPFVSLRAKDFTLAPGAERTWDIPYYLGAKGYTLLARYRLGLEKSVDFGIFRDLGRPLLRLLHWLQGRVGNWGWAIVIMTFLIQTLLLPLTIKSLKSMAVMKRLQPEISKLQQKYSKEPGRLNSEMMELYKKAGANPLGGCLPLMLQMPVFIALFNALRNSWELHGAPWIWWVHDLAAKDPFYVLPIVMGGVMFAQNRLNPAATNDPTQKTMMTWMPVIFTVMFLKTPAGLVLYWLTSSIISSALQMGLRRQFEAA